MVTRPYGCFCNGSDRYQWKEIQATAGCHLAWLVMNLCRWNCSRGIMKLPSSLHKCSGPKGAEQGGAVSGQWMQGLAPWMASFPHCVTYSSCFPSLCPGFLISGGLFQLLYSISLRNVWIYFLHNPLSTYTVTRRNVFLERLCTDFPLPAALTSTWETAIFFFLVAFATYLPENRN